MEGQGGCQIHYKYTLFQSVQLLNEGQMSKCSTPSVGHLTIIERLHRLYLDNRNPRLGVFNNVFRSSECSFTYWHRNLKTIFFLHAYLCSEMPLKIWKIGTTKKKKKFYQLKEMTKTSWTTKLWAGGGGGA